MNVVELEKQWAKMKELSQLFTPDTSKLGTVQQVIKRKEMYENLKKVSGIDQAFLKRLLEDSILSSFNQDDLILDLIVPFFRLRLDPVITDYIGELFADPEKSALIRAKFKKGIDGQERFTTVFNNAVVNFIYQNDMSNFVEDGKFVNFPKVYEGLNISVNDESPYAAIAEEGKLILNTRQIESEYANKKYLTTSTTEDSNINTGLDAFTLKQDPFNTLESYYRYVIARETLRFNTTEETLEGNKYFERKVKELDDVNMAYESYISEKALAESFNFNYIMGKTKYSYTQTVLDTINEFTTEDFNIKDAYPILAQLAPAPNKEGLKLLQLNNKKEAQGTLASSYYLDIRKLADPSIMKVANRADNNRISEVFSSFSLMMYYQHGLGKTTLGFVKALDPSRYKNIMTTAVENFMADELREYVLDDIFATVMTDARFKNHLLNSQDYIHEDIAQEEQDRILPTETIEEVYPEGEANEVTLIPGKRVVFEEDVNAFKAVLAQLGRKPDVWFTSKTTFSEFYNSNTGKREGMPQSAQWVKNSRELYDMIDKDPEMEGVIYYENVDLATGLQMLEKDAPVKEETPPSTTNVENVETNKNIKKLNSLKLFMINYKETKVLKVDDEVEVYFDKSDSTSVLTIKSIKKINDMFKIELSNNSGKTYTYIVDKLGKGTTMEVEPDNSLLVFEKDLASFTNASNEFKNLKEVKQSFIQGKLSAPTIGNLEKYTINRNINNVATDEVEDEGYKLTFDGHPNAIFYLKVDKYENGDPLGWVVENVNTGYRASNVKDTAEESYKEFMTKLTGAIENVDISNENN